MKQFVLLAGMLLAATGLQAQGPSAGYAVGDKALAFNLKNIDGKMVALKDQPKGAIIVFTCNHCPYAKAYEDRIVALDKKYRSQGYPVIAINPNEQTVADDNFANMQVRAKEKGFTFPYLVDADQSVAKAYGATRTPHVYVVQREGNDYVVRYIGAIDDNTEDGAAAQNRYVEAAVDALVAGKAVATANTKAVGCTIKWKKNS